MKTNIEASLIRAVGQLPRPDFSAIADVPIEKLSEHDEITKQTAANKTSNLYRLVKYAATCAALIALTCVGWYYQFGAVASVVDLEVNPAFELCVSRAEKLLEVRAANEDAKAFLQGRSYKGWDLDEAISSIVLSLAEESYLSSDKNVVHLSVRGTNAKKLLEQLSVKICSALETKGIEAEILPATSANGNAPSEKLPQSAPVTTDKPQPAAPDKSPSPSTRPDASSNPPYPNGSGNSSTSPTDDSDDDKDSTPDDDDDCGSSPESDDSDGSSDLDDNDRDSSSNTDDNDSSSPDSDDNEDSSENDSVADSAFDSSSDGSEDD